MSQEDKDLLFKNLCARLPYDVMVNVDGYDTEKLIGIENETITTKATPTSYSNKGEYPIDIVKPYLRPMSSMTEKEEKELHKISNCHLEKIKCYNKKTNCCDLLKVKITNNYTPFGTFEVESEYSLVEQDNILAIIDYLNSHHFDYRGLIEKDLAIEAPEGMYK